MEKKHILTREERENFLFIHKTITNLTWAQNCHLLMALRKRKGAEQKDYSEILEGAKFEFRTYMKSHAKGWRTNELNESKRFSRNKLINAYYLSDFDWGNYRRFNRFKRWFMNIETPH